MHPTTKADILNVLVKARIYLEIRDLGKLKEISNHLVHDVSIYRSSSAMNLAVAIYALSKLLEHPVKTNRIASFLHDAEHYLELDKVDKYRSTIDKLLAHIRNLDSQFSRHVDEVLVQAQIKKGSTLFEHGISLAKSAETFGISRWELMPFVGMMSLAETNTHMDLANRLNFTRKLFEK